MEMKDPFIQTGGAEGQHENSRTSIRQTMMVSFSISPAYAVLVSRHFISSLMAFGSDIPRHL
jgi:hypothetical protein